MADPTRSEGVLEDASNLAAAARDRGIEELEGAKGHLAEGAERVAAAVDRTADELDGEGADAISGFGHSVASLMRQLAGGLRERDVEQFARELGELARRNPGVFLAGSVALGFGVARFFKARPPQRAVGYDGGWQEQREQAGAEREEREEFDADEDLDLSGNPTGVERRVEDESPSYDASRSVNSAGSESSPPSRGEETKSRGAGKRSKGQRAAVDSTSAPAASDGLADGGARNEFSGDTGGKGS
jgi:hypothetical protein